VSRGQRGGSPTVVNLAMDCFTKWPEAYAIPDQEASTVADALVTSFFCRFGMPR
jgi:hypothetical protein